MAGTIKLSNVRSFSNLQSVEGSGSFNNYNSANFSVENKYNEEFFSAFTFTKTFGFFQVLEVTSEQNKKKAEEKVCN